MVQVNIQTPIKPDKAIVAALKRVAEELKAKTAVTATAPERTYNLTVHVRPESSAK